MITQQAMTRDQFIEVRKLAFRYFNTNRMMNSLTRDDFVAECALAVSKYMRNKDVIFEEVPIISVVNYACNNFVASAYNLERMPKKAWGAAKFEINCDHDLMASFPTNTSTDEVDLLILTRSANKVLNTRQRAVFDKLLEGHDPRAIAKHLGVSYMTVVRIMKTIQRILEEEGIV